VKLTAGVGFTVIVYVVAAPAQLFAITDAVTVAVIADDPVLVAVKAETLLLPPVARPMLPSELVQEIVELDTLLVSVVRGAASPLQ
jgi:hypothetical protein